MDPIFILGAPRSGTSLLRVLLNRHPSISLCDETYFFFYVFTRRRAFGDLKNLKARRFLVDKYLETNRIKRLCVNLDDLSNALMQEGVSYKSFFDSLMRFYAQENGKTRHGEKTPQHAIFSEILCKWFPECKLLHVVRDPRDVVASLLRMPWGSQSILANSRIWLRCTRGALSCNNRSNYMQVQYEKLVSEPEKELKNICSFLDEEYQPSLLDADETAESDKWWFQRAHKPLTTRRAGKWSEQLYRDQVALVEWLTGEYMRSFGYEPTGWEVSPTKILIAFATEIFEAIKNRIVKLPRMFYHWIQPTNLAAEEAWIERNL